MKTILFACTLVLLGACASKPPASISKLPADNPSLTRVRMDIDAFIGAEVRWGGVISRVENKADQTWVEIVRHSLRDNGRPRTSSKSDGRYIASFRDFVDPVVYETGRPLTVVGSIVGKTSRVIGEYDYKFPIVEVEGSFLWKAQPVVHYVDYPHHWWYYDPWYHPYGPYRHHHPYH